MNIYESISRIMAEATPISKDKLNKQQGFKYRGIDDVMNTFYPLLAKHKVFIVPEVVEQQREERSTKNGGNLIYSILKIKFTFYAEDGSNISAVVIGEGMDSADKSSNKAMAVGMKYAMFQVFCIPTEDMIDPDSESHPKSVPFSEITEEEKGEEIEIWHRLQEAKEIFIPNTQTQLKSLTKAQLQRLTTQLDTMPEQARAASYILQHDKSIQ
ncbi:MAG: ERF family protein [Clostridia bacterium]|nr:ERF family protein [Clostridia bacterium]